MEEEGKNLISPCNCTGSLIYVHSDCLKSWINTFLCKSAKNVKSKKAHVYCELCNGKISFTVHSSIACKSKEQFCKTVKDKKLSFIGLALLILVNLIFFLALLAYMISSRGFSQTKSRVMLYNISIAGEVFFMLVMVSSVLYFINRFSLNRKSIVL